MALPILYSLRNCPYAMRARLAIFKSQQPVALRDVVLTNKPAEMILASAKATVPILVLSKIVQANGKKGAEVTVKVIDESLDIMLWALNNSDPSDLLHSANPEILTQMLALIADFDVEFKRHLEAYKCAKRYHEDNLADCRAACEVYIQRLESRLIQHAFLFSAQDSLADIALLPFIRQFARIERQWYLQSPYPNLKKWLNSYLQSPMFTKVMAKHPLWLDSGKEIVF
ncbi:glutathione S-transferase [Colwellia sp. M166]|uniref:glutathione S-transferase n=1 Tax=Colwellia sp. M166 TaxID=2583805 RepID=UPI00211E162A|nr:glutathione S-transferase [Colwellia sp. M166]UUO21775.1 glutathione S-transferase [Colwellia sp. M166]|tara:strand:- start:4089 stop:4772 length:684 start_codon:yes stop_codon:yes gene_type:complete